MKDMKAAHSYHLHDYFRKRNLNDGVENSKTEYRKLKTLRDLASRLDRFIVYIVYTISLKAKGKIRDMKIEGSKYVPKDPIMGA